ncbi:MAG TPA: STAS domain-containing protein [Candidatus Krumholzibacteria bacterium]
MFEIRRGANGEVLLTGRLDAAQVDRVRDELKNQNTSCEVNFEHLDYISSAGMGVLLGIQKRLSASGQGLILTHMNRHIRELFTIAGFNHVFTIK